VQPRSVANHAESADVERVSKIGSSNMFQRMGLGRFWLAGLTIAGQTSWYLSMSLHDVKAMRSCPAHPNGPKRSIKTSTTVFSLRNYSTREKSTRGNISLRTQRLRIPPSVPPCSKRTFSHYNLPSFAVHKSSHIWKGFYMHFAIRAPKCACNYMLQFYVAGNA
jgi:hypothetical protein